MKTQIKKTVNAACILTVAIFLLINSAVGQTYWFTGAGNPCVGNTPCVPLASGGVDATNNFIGTDASNAIPVKLGANGNTSQLFLAASSSNVGIGTTSPAALLSVGSGSPFQVNSSGAIGAATGITSSGTITFSGLSAGGVVKANTSGVLSIGVANTDYQAPMTGGTGITIASGTVINSVWTASGTNIYNGNTGNVGINTTSPAARLHVVGVINASGTGAEYKIGGVRGLFLAPGNTNLFAGEGSGLANTGVDNTFFGYHTGIYNTDGNYNTFVGFNSGYSNTEGHANTFVGAGAGSLNSAALATGNTFVGFYSGESNNGEFNTFIGYATGVGNKGDKNLFAGGSAGQQAIGSNNSFLGWGSGSNTTYGGLNAFLGSSSGAYNTLGNGNTFLGSNSGFVNTTGNYNTYIGYEAQGTNAPSNPNLTNACAIGANSTVTASNCMVLGSITDIPLPGIIGVNVGIGTPEPTAKLEVQNDNQRIGAFVSTTRSTAFENFGVFGSSVGSSHQNIGLHGVAGVPNFPMVGTANFLLNFGVRGHAQGGGWDIGGIFEANDVTDNSLNIGVYASATSLRIPLLGGTLELGWAGFFQGNVVRTGNDNFASDIMFKDSVEDVNSALITLSKLNAKQFVFKSDSFPYMNFPGGRNIGFIAQQMDTVVPELVTNVINPAIRDSAGNVLEDTLTFKAVNYIGLIPLLVSGINELNTAKIISCSTPTDSNYIPKWSAVTQTLCNSIIYDNGNQIGISTIEPVSKTTILNGDVPDLFSSIIEEFETDFDLTITSQNIGLTVFSSSNDSINIGTMSIAENDEAVNIGGGCGAHGDDAIVNIGWAASASGENVERANAALLGTASGEGSVNYGVSGQGEGGTENVGVYGIAESSETEATAYGIVGNVDGEGADFYAGYFHRDVTITGTLYETSDAKLKDNVEDISNAMNLLNELQPKNFEYKTSAYEDLNLPEGNQYGLIAQEVEAVLPELVRDITSPTPRDKNGKATGQPTEYKGVNYTGFIPLLIKGIQEQQAVIDSMSKRLAEVESRVDNCCGGTGFKTSGDDDNVNRLTVELASLQAVVLDQNVPNPFAEQTSISYFIPEDNEGKAQVIFFDITGRVIKTVDVQKGYGIMTVFAHNLSTGSYSYSLMLDGKAVETKRMVKMK